MVPRSASIVAVLLEGRAVQLETKLLTARPRPGTSSIYSGITSYYQHPFSLMRMAHSFNTPPKPLPRFIGMGQMDNVIMAVRLKLVGWGCAVVVATAPYNSFKYIIIALKIYA